MKIKAVSPAALSGGRRQPPVPGGKSEISSFPFLDPRAKKKRPDGLIDPGHVQCCLSVQSRAKQANYKTYICMLQFSAVASQDAKKRTDSHLVFACELQCAMCIHNISVVSAMVVGKCAMCRKRKGHFEDWDGAQGWIVPHQCTVCCLFSKNCSGLLALKFGSNVPC